MALFSTILAKGMELTPQEKQFIVEVLVQVSLNYQASQLRDQVIQKLQLPPNSNNTPLAEIIPESTS